MPVLGTYEDILKVVQTEQIQQVFFALPLESSSKLPDMLNLLLRTEPVDVHVVPDLAQWIVLGGGVYNLGSLPVVSLQDSPIGGWEAFGEATFRFDIWLTTVALGGTNNPHVRCVGEN